MKKLLYITLLIFIAACADKNSKNQTEKTVEAELQAPITLTPGTDTLQQPQTINLADKPKPTTIAVPTKTGSFYTKKKKDGTEVKIDLVPPAKQTYDSLLPQGIPNFKTFTTDDGLALDAILSSIEDKTGNLWFGTQGGGVSRYDGKSFTNYTTAQGLPDNVITQVVLDKTTQSNIVWASNFGVGVGVSFTPKFGDNKEQRKIPVQNNLTNEQLKNYTLNVEVYNSATGYPIKDVNVGQNCMMQDSKGVYWAATGSDATALVRFDYKALNRNPKPPVVVIKNIKIQEENICFYNLQPQQDSTTCAQQEIATYGKLLANEVRDSLVKKFGDIQFDGIAKWNPLPENLVLPYKHNNVSFDFLGIETSRNYLVRYQYMLEGYDENWSPVTDKTSATFGNIYEGTYTFKLKAQSPEGLWSEPTTYTFKVLPPWYRSWWAYTVYVVLGLTVLWLIYRWRMAALLKEKELLEQKVELRTHQLQEEKKETEKQRDKAEANEKEALKQKEIADSQRAIAEEQRSFAEEQKHLVEEQKHLVEEKQKEIVDSISYAKRLQEAILPPNEFVNSNLPYNFIYYQPKDIVAGDFYWAEKVGEKFFIAAADSTGHGVPGAMVSVVCSNALNRTIKEFKLTETGKILDKTRELVLETFEKSASEVKDGMDISLLCIDSKNKNIFWSGANNPLWFIQDNELKEIKADKQPIGKSDYPKPFTTHQIEYKANTTFYLFTDGFADQFGGPNGKKFKYKQFSDLLVKSNHLSQKQQANIIEKAFSDWKGDLEQVDDVCVIGVKIT